MRRGVRARRCLRLRDDGRQRRRLHLVHLGQHELERHRRLVQHPHRRLVGRLEADPRVDQQHDAAQCRPSAQIGEHRPLPRLLHALRRLGIAVARHVHEGEPAGEVEEVELLGAPGRGRDPRQRPPSGERIEQRRLADIRAAGERHLGPARRRQLIHRLRRVEEAALAGEQHAPGLDQRCPGRLVRRLGEAARSRHVFAGAGCCCATLRMITHCCAIDSRLFQDQ